MEYFSRHSQRACDYGSCSAGLRNYWACNIACAAAKHKEFLFTIIGLLGILLPSITACVCILGFGQYYSGRLSLGITPIISPIAVLISIGSVVRRKKKVAEELRKEAEEKGLIQRAGDL